MGRTYYPCRMEETKSLDQIFEALKKYPSRLNKEVEGVATLEVNSPIGGKISFTSLIQIKGPARQDPLSIEFGLEEKRTYKIGSRIFFCEIDQNTNTLMLMTSNRGKNFARAFLDNISKIVTGAEKSIQFQDVKEGVINELCERYNGTYIGSLRRGKWVLKDLHTGHEEEITIDPISFVDIWSHSFAYETLSLDKVPMESAKLLLNLPSFSEIDLILALYKQKDYLYFAISPQKWWKYKLTDEQYALLGNEVLQMLEGKLKGVVHQEKLALGKVTAD